MVQDSPEAVGKRPSAALPSSLVTAAYFYVCLFPRDFGSLAYGHFPSASQEPVFDSLLIIQNGWHDILREGEYAVGGKAISTASADDGQSFLISFVSTLLNVAKILAFSKGEAGLDDETLLGQLEELAQSLEIEIRYEPLKREGSFFPGGLCQIKGEYVLILNSTATIEDKIHTLAKAVNRFDLSRVYLRPGLREFLDKL